MASFTKRLSVVCVTHGSPTELKDHSQRPVTNISTDKYKHASPKGRSHHVIREYASLSSHCTKKASSCANVFVSGKPRHAGPQGGTVCPHLASGRQSAQTSLGEAVAGCDSSGLPSLCRHSLLSSFGDVQKLGHKTQGEAELALPSPARPHLGQVSPVRLLVGTHNTC